MLRADDLLFRPHEEEADQQEERGPVRLRHGAGDAGDRAAPPTEPGAALVALAVPNAVPVVLLPSRAA